MRLAAGERLDRRRRVGVYVQETGEVHLLRDALHRDAQVGDAGMAAAVVHPLPHAQQAADRGGDDVRDAGAVEDDLARSLSQQVREVGVEFVRILDRHPTIDREHVYFAIDVVEDLHDVGCVYAGSPGGRQGEPA